MEIIDLYDCQKRNTKKTIEREMLAPTGKYKQIVHIWIINSRGELLIQKRSKTRKRNPEKWSFTGGAIDTGETSLQGALRETKEEIGLDLKEEELEFILSFKRELVFVDVWLGKIDLDESKLILQKEEVSEVKWVTLNELKEMIDRGEFVHSIELYYELFMRVLDKCYNVNK